MNGLDDDRSLGNRELQRRRTGLRTDRRRNYLIGARRRPLRGPTAAAIRAAPAPQDLNRRRGGAAEYHRGRGDRSGAILGRPHLALRLGDASNQRAGTDIEGAGRPRAGELKHQRHFAPSGRRPRYRDHRDLVSQTRPIWLGRRRRRGLHRPRRRLRRARGRRSRCGCRRRCGRYHRNLPTRVLRTAAAAQQPDARKHQGQRGSEHEKPSEPVNPSRQPARSAVRGGHK